jgi:hypothetical protein
MTNQHPITPPPELVKKLQEKAPYFEGVFEREQCLINAAYQAGADQELEACCAEMDGWGDIHYSSGWKFSKDLRAARRPKPPTLKEQAQAELDRLIALIPTEGAMAMAEPIRRALEALPGD